LGLALRDAPDMALVVAVLESLADFLLVHALALLSVHAELHEHLDVERRLTHQEPIVPL